MTETATAFENGQRVQTTNFDFEQFDRNAPAGVTEKEVPAWEFLLHEPKAAALLAKMARVILRIADAKNSKMSAECFLVAIGDKESSYDGDEAAARRTITALAKKHGVGKAAASKCCVDWCEYLGKKPSDFMRREAAKESFKKSNVTRKKSK